MQTVKAHLNGSYTNVTIVNDLPAIGDVDHNGQMQVTRIEEISNDFNSYEDPQVSDYKFYEIYAVDLLNNEEDREELLNEIVAIEL